MILACNTDRSGFKTLEGALRKYKSQHKMRMNSTFRRVPGLGTALTKAALSDMEEQGVKVRFFSLRIFSNQRGKLTCTFVDKLPVACVLGNLTGDFPFSAELQCLQLSLSRAEEHFWSKYSAKIQMTLNKCIGTP